MVFRYIYILFLAISLPVNMLALFYLGEKAIGLSMITLINLFFILNIHLFYIIASAPLRRKEIIRNFLDVISIGMKNGKSPEMTIIELSHQGNHELGDNLDRVAKCINAGDGLTSSISKNRFMPENITGILKVGVLCGDFNKVLPACYESLKQYQSRSRAVLNYLLPFLILFQTGLVLASFTASVLPKMGRIFLELTHGGVFLRFADSPFVSILYLPLVLYAIIFFIVLLSAFTSLKRLNLLKSIMWNNISMETGIFMVSGIKKIMDSVNYYLVPWKRNRIRSGFASMLAILLDTGIPEAKALAVAAESTGNSAIGKLSKSGVKLLEQGYMLPDVLTGLFDNKGELAWRLCNSRHKGSSLNVQIKGWGSFLEASAFQSEQAFAHVMSTLILMCLGAMVGLVAIMMFSSLVSVITTASLW